ncbi:MAG: C2 family cysteine protease [Cyanobacteria bacterium P01_D01_bin.50]
MESSFFDADYYRGTHSDLSQFSDEQALAHFQAYGLNEGRSFSPLIHLSLYRESNSDLENFDNAQLLEHLEQFGLNEGRKFSNIVDLDLYRALNSDLAEFQGNDALQHLKDFGLNEGRLFSQYLDLGFYQEANSDLTEFTKAEALQHLINYGLNEKRIFSSYVDLELYQDFNEDLKQLNLTGTQLLKHLDSFGIGEGRQFSYPFDIGYYEYENPDVVTAYADSRSISAEQLQASSAEQTGLYKFLFKHFITNGASEGRRSSDEFDVNTYMSSNQDLSSLNKSQLYKHFRLLGINEERVFSDNYNAKYYKENNSASQNSNLRELFKYYITNGINFEFAVANPKFPNEVIPELDLTEISLLGGSKEFTGKLSTDSETNPYRSISYGNFYELFGIEIGNQVTLKMTATSPNFDTYLQVIDGYTGDLIAENNDISNDNKNSSLSFKVEEGIEYEVIATSLDAKNLGNYNLTAEVSATAGETVKIGDSDTATLNDDLFNPARKDTYRLDRKLDLTGVADEQVVSLKMDSAAFDPYLQLIDGKTGEVLAQNDNAASLKTDAEILFSRQSGVDYILRFTSSTPEATGSFNYNVSLVNQESPTLPSIAPDQTISGIVNSDDDIDTYNLDTTGIEVGTKVRINLTSSEFDTRVRVKDTSGTILFENDDISADNYNSQLEFTIEDGANYKIEVDSAAISQFGEYDLAIATLNSNDGGGNSTGITLRDSALNNLLGSKNTLTRTDILQFFSKAQENGSISILEKADLRTLVDKASIFNLTDSVKFLTDKVVTGITEQMAAVDFDNLVGKYFFGTQGPSANYVGAGDSARGKADTKTTKFTYKTILGDFFGSNPGDGRTPGQPRIRDVNQGSFGNCVYIASLGALFPLPQKPGNVNNNSNFLNGFITANNKETYNGKEYESWTFRFYHNSNPHYVTVDRQIITIDNQLHGANRGGKNPTTSLANDGQAIWVPIAEKAYAQFREEIDGGKSGKSGYTLTGNGDSTQGALKFITGQQPTTLLLSSGSHGGVNYSNYTHMTFDAIKSAVDSGKIIVMGTEKASDRLVGQHAFTLTDAYVKDGEQRIVVRNPWGTDGGNKTDDNPNDGFIDMSYKEFDEAKLDVAIFERSLPTKTANVA